MQSGNYILNLAKLSLVDNLFLAVAPNGQKSSRVVNRQDYAVSFAGLNHPVSVLQCGCKRLLAEDAFDASVGGVDDNVSMPVIGDANRHDIKGGFLFKHFFVVAVDAQTRKRCGVLGFERRAHLVGCRLGLTVC